MKRYLCVWFPDWPLTRLRRARRGLRTGSARPASGKPPDPHLPFALLENSTKGLRIAAAKDLLRRSNLSVGDIAFQLGLQDVSYFAKLFRQHSGMSPLRYREAVRGKLFDPGSASRP